MRPFPLRPDAKDGNPKDSAPVYGWRCDCGAWREGFPTRDAAHADRVAHAATHSERTVYHG